MSFNALSIAKLGVGFGALAVASIGLLAPTPVEAESTLHQGGPDRQVVERITRPADWKPWDADSDIFVLPPAQQPDRTTTTPGVVPPDLAPTNASTQNAHLARLAQQDVDLLKKQADEVFAARQHEAMLLALSLVLALDENDDD